MNKLKLLIVEGNTKEENINFNNAGCVPQSQNFKLHIKKLEPNSEIDIVELGNDNSISKIFSSLKKYDGRYNRNLHPAEIGQIAGRAGRFQHDGTFGLTKDAGDLDPLIIQSVEEHNFIGIRKINFIIKYLIKVILEDRIL